MDQNAQRREARRRRRQMPAAERQRAALQICRRLLQFPALRRARNIAAYLSMGSELDLSPLLHELAGQRRGLYLPILAPPPQQQLQFACWTPDTPCRPNRLGIPEPVGSIPRKPAFLDVVIAPLVAFDSRLNRIGQGGGFYDRSFAFLQHRQRWRRPLLIGAAFECQRLEHIDPAPWDVPLDAVITETTQYLSATAYPEHT